MRKSLIVFVVALTAACAGGQIKQIPTNVPPVVGGTVNGTAVATLTRMNDLSVVVKNTLKLYNTASPGIVPAEADKQIRQAFVNFADESDRIGGQIVNTLNADQIVTMLQPLFKAGSNLTAVVNKVLASQRTGGWFEMLGTALEILSGLPSKSPMPLLVSEGISGGRLSASLPTLRRTTPPSWRANYPAIFHLSVRRHTDRSAEFAAVNVITLEAFL